MKGQAAPNYRKRKSKKVESNLNLVHTIKPSTTKTNK
jgi:hypothetical protein